MFQKINLLSHKITVSNSDFAKAINSNREFAITLDGKIDYNFSDKEIYIFKGKANLLTSKEPLGNRYKISSNFVSVSIDCSKNWGEIEDLNSKIALYNDDSAEGVDSFNDEVMETIGWHSVEFDITYRELVEQLEKHCDGTLLCIEKEDEPYLFNGLGFIFQEDEVEKGRKLLKEFAKERILNKLEEERDEYKKYGFSEEELESLNYFQISSKI